MRLLLFIGLMLCGCSSAEKCAKDSDCDSSRDVCEYSTCSPPSSSFGGGGGGAGGGSGSALDVTGTWTTTFANSNGIEFTRPLSMVQTSSGVSGEYKPSADPYGVLDGTVTGRVLSGRWVQGSAGGPIKFTFSSDGLSFTGYWTYDGETNQRKWTGSRTSATPTNLFPGGTGGSSSGGCHANSDCSRCQRCELSTGRCLTRPSC